MERIAVFFRVQHPDSDSRAIGEGIVLKHHLAVHDHPGQHVYGFFGFHIPKLAPSGRAVMLFRSGGADLLVGALWQPVGKGLAGWPRKSACGL